MTHQHPVTIITGGGGYIGRCIAKHLLEEGHTVVLADRDEEAARAAAEELDPSGAHATAVMVDISDPASCRHLAAQVIRAHGRIDVLINNAGGSARLVGGAYGSFHEACDKVIAAMIDINLKGPMFCTHAIIPHMIAQGTGRIINMASITGIQGLERVVDYSAAKGGVIAFTKALAKELGPHGITVNAVSPGLAPRPGEDHARALASNYLGRVCTADDIATMVVFLSSPNAGFITGHNHVIDGGRSLGMKA